MNRIYLDLETTGLETDSSIIEISARYYKGDKQVTCYSSKGFNENSIVNLDALRVNKYKFSDLRRATPEKEMLMGFFDWLLSIEGNPDLGGVNVHFDYNLVKERAKKYNIIVGSALPYRLHDITNISRVLAKVGLLNVKKSGPGNSLKDLADALEVSYDEKSLHTADGDTALYYPIDIKLEEILNTRK